jgi:hypothetical protein
MKVRNMKSFSPASGAVMEDLIRYALVEELRKSLPKFVAGELDLPEKTVYEASAAGPGIEAYEIMHRQLAENVQTGVAEGRAYGGCASLELQDANDPTRSSQEIFGGRDDGEGEACVYTHDGCYCCPYADDGKPLPRNVEVQARRDKDGKAHCMRSGCGAWLSADGKNGDIGHIARKAQEVLRQSREVVAKEVVALEVDVKSVGEETRDPAGVK